MADGTPPVALRPERPPRTPLARVRAAAGLDVDESAADVVVTGVTLHAQGVLDGDLFAALPGARVHGARFAADAIERGARAIITDEAGERMIRSVAADGPAVPSLVCADPRAVLGRVAAVVYGRPSQDMTVIGVTGTAGKTTTSYLVEAGLIAAGKRAGLIGTVETRIDGEPVPSSLTTPEAPALQAMLALMRERGMDAVVMEVSSHALALGRVDGTRFAAAGFTNLSQDHLDFHGDMDHYFAAKSRLFAPDSSVRARSAVVCVDGEWGPRMADVARSAPPLPTMTVAMEPEAAADWTAGACEPVDGGGQAFTVRAPSGRRVRVVLPMPGRFNVANTLVALSLLDVAGVDADAAAAGFAAASVPGRLEAVDRGQPYLAIIDYAHKPAALEAVIATLRAQTSGRIAVVIGAGGDRDSGKRPLMGAAAAAGAELTVVTDDNPRTENPQTIRAEVLAGATGLPAERRRGRVIEEGDRAAAIGAAVRWARPGDTVLVAGKGHETGQEIDGVHHPFDDREVVAEAVVRTMARTTTEKGEMTGKDAMTGKADE